MDTLKLYGPPGCGKTHNGLDWMQYQVSQGADPREIAFVSFTNAACDEARTRIGQKFELYDWELPYCATLHSLCRSALRVEGRDWLAENRLSDFAEKHSYDLVKSRKSRSRATDTEDFDEIAAQRGQDAPLLEMLNWGRQRCIETPDAIYAAFCDYDPESAYRVPYDRFCALAQDYRDWKTLSFLKDYTDLLEEVVEQGCRLSASVAAIDEVQDMTPLLWAAADTLFRHTPIRASFGDDDQAIFTFQGSDPSLFNSRAAEQTFLLGQSYRLPRRIAEHAARLIGTNANRIAKQLLPVTREIVERRPGREGPATEAELEGELRRVSGLRSLDLLNGESWFLLIRNWSFLADLTGHLESAGIPYRVAGESYYHPWQEKGPLQAVRTIYTLSDGKKVPLSQLRPLLDKTRAETKKTPGTWQYGAKSRLETLIEEQPEERVTLVDLPHLGLTEWAFDRIVQRNLEILAGGISERDLNAYSASQRAGTWGQEPRVTLSTIHGVKGAEADNVAALTCCTVMPYRNLERPERREEEVRLAYVAITRARKRFFAVEHEFGQPYEVFGV